VRALLIGLLCIGCPTVEEAPTDDDDATPPPEESVGCDPVGLTEGDVCNDGHNRSAYSSGTDYCPEFWEAQDLEDGWQTLSSRWTLDFTAVVPGDAVDHWEYRNIQGETLTTDLPVDVISSQGTACATAADEVACLAALDALRPIDGFVTGCGPGGCSADYLALSRGDSVLAVTDGAGMVDFLGTVEDPVEAALLASAAVPGFGWSTGALEAGGVRAVDGGFELLGTVVVWSAPFRADVVHLSVSDDGVVTTLDRALNELDCTVEL
jgi:hypothetical protein